MEEERKEDVCVVCCLDVLIFAIGVCDHPVCHECSTRMRVLCRQNECPICRQELPKVIFTRTLQKFATISNNVYPSGAIDRRHRIYFEDRSVQGAYNRLLEHGCNICKDRPVFKNFDALSEHMRKDHQEFFCELCVKNLRIFSFERKSYSRADLAHHRRIGDLDNKSHRGHPLCEFCDERYMDRDELFRHLRMEHFFCHFCDADGLHQYYRDYEFLRRHFRETHYLCEEGPCAEEKFTSVFRTDIDLKAHTTSTHHKYMTKAQAKQARTLELEFTITPRTSTVNGVACEDIENRRTNSGRGHFNRRGGGGRHYRDEIQDFQEDMIAPTSHAAILNTNCDKEFPTLEGAIGPEPRGNSRGSESMAQKLSKKNRFTVRANDQNTEEFPSLGPAEYHNPGSETSVTVTSGSSSYAVPQRPSGAKKTVKLSFNSNDFPALASRNGVSSISQNARPTNVSIQVSRKQAPPRWERQAMQIDSSFEPHLTSMIATPNVTIQPAPPQPSMSYAPKPFRSTDDDFPQLTSFQPAQLNGKWTAPAKLNGNIKSKSRSTANNHSGRSSPFKKASSISIPVNGPSGLQAVADSLLSSNGGAKKKKQKSSAESKSYPVGLHPKTYSDSNNNAQENKESEPNKKKKKPPPEETSFHSKGHSTLTKANQENKDPIGAHLKRSELKIGSLNRCRDSVDDAEEDLSNLTKTLVMDDFPSLATSIKQKVKGSKDPPPGFDSDASAKTAPPPPGFSVTLNSIARPSNGSAPSSITFTNSSGESFAMSSAKQQAHRYIEPADFQRRNYDLILLIQALLNDTIVLTTFKSMSGQFRQGKISASDYHHRCMELIGRRNFMRVFPELLVLLPDIGKQQELLNIHNNCRKQVVTQSSPDEEGMSELLSSGRQFLVCATCQQVLAHKDFHRHMAAHDLDCDYPILTDSTETIASNITWVKK